MKCGHCKRLAPVWDELAESIAADPKLASRVIIAKVDADADRDLGNRFGITGFPTLQFFARGKPVDEPTKSRSPPTRTGAVAALDSLAAGFGLSTDQDSLIGKAKEALASLVDEDASNGALYVRYMSKIAEKGAAWIDTELTRLQKLASGKLSSTKLQEIGKKISVLSAFNEPTSASA
ncbi:hypothetical protein QBZ16_004867 [Prototheca wickerhamii]|uniref:protein disulfide-isomerase n=1 Tax=Prototheca wickerhamii TaxID=3111 RepID=A0AAD9IGJ8_PROWI|nr:hypothetical protein QBZ16_004867 [Prototheca wickerhamii]